MVDDFLLTEPLGNRYHDSYVAMVFFPNDWYIYTRSQSGCLTVILTTI